jgi:hypothetical protein
MENLREEALEGLPKLHGQGWGQAGGGVVNAVEREVNDDTGATIALGDDAKRREAEVRQAANKAVGEDGPVAAGHKISHLFAEKLSVIAGRGVAAAFHHAVKVLKRPGGGVVGDNGGAIAAEMVQEIGGGMLEAA